MIEQLLVRLFLATRKDRYTLIKGVSAVEKGQNT